MNVEEMKTRLNEITKIIFSKHVILKAKIRDEISEDALLSQLKTPQNLTYCQYQGEEYGCSKYALIFDKSNKYDIRIIISIKENCLTVVTAHIQNKKKRKRLEKWLKR